MLTKRDGNNELLPGLEVVASGATCTIFPFSERLREMASPRGFEPRSLE